MGPVGAAVVIFLAVVAVVGSVDSSAGAEEAELMADLRSGRLGPPIVADAMVARPPTARAVKVANTLRLLSFIKGPLGCGRLPPETSPEGPWRYTRSPARRVAAGTQRWSGSDKWVRWAPRGAAAQPVRAPLLAANSPSGLKRDS